MPIPTGGPWPPPAFTPAYQAYADWDAWYVGDPDKLRDRYRLRGATTERQPPSSRTKPGQLAGGIIGRFSRWLWGRPATPTWQDTRLHVPLPADLAATSANLLFSEPPKLTADTVEARPGQQQPTQAPAGAQERLDQLTEDGLSVLLLHAAEVASFLGDVYLRPVVDQEVLPGRAFLATVHADSALPTIRWGRLTEVTFWSTVHADGQTIWRLLEHHEPGRIIYRLHEGGPMQLGRPRPLDALPDVASMVGPDVADDGSQPTGLDELDVVRIPNAGPQRQWRTNPHLRYLGRSDFDGNEQPFDRFDEVWTSWMRDVRLAKARISVPSVMMQDAGPGQGATWDPDREIYSQLTALPKDMTGNGLTLSQFAIRHQEHRATTEALTEVILRHAGLNIQTLGGVQEGGGAATATEIRARERQSFTTRGNRIQSWRPALADAVRLLLTVERVSGLSRVEPFEPSIEFGDSVSESPKMLAETINLLKQADAASFKTRVQMAHPEWDDPQVLEETERLMREAGVSVEDPDTFRGAAPPSGPGQQPPDEPPEGDSDEE